MALETSTVFYMLQGLSCGVPLSTLTVALGTFLPSLYDEDDAMKSFNKLSPMVFHATLVLGLAVYVLMDCLTPAAKPRFYYSTSVLYPITTVPVLLYLFPLKTGKYLPPFLYAMTCLVGVTTGMYSGFVVESAAHNDATTGFFLGTAMSTVIPAVVAVGNYFQLRPEREYRRKVHALFWMVSSFLFVVLSAVCMVSTLKEVLTEEETGEKVALDTESAGVDTEEEEEKKERTLFRALMQVLTKVEKCREDCIVHGVLFVVGTTTALIRYHILPTLEPRDVQYFVDNPDLFLCLTHHLCYGLSFAVGCLDASATCGGEMKTPIKIAIKATVRTVIIMPIYAFTNVAAITMVPSVLGDVAVMALNTVFFESGGCIVASCFQTFGKGKADVVLGLIDMALGDICTTSMIAIISLLK